MTINITKLSTPNCGVRNLKYKPDMIVYHITEGSYNGAVEWLRNPKSVASANFVMSKTGKVTQLVDITKKAWCNGTSTDSKGKYYYKRSTNPLVLARGGNVNDYSTSIENEGFFAKTGGALEPAHLAGLIELTHFIRMEVKRIYGITIPIDRDHLVGHYEIAPKEKPNCPGDKFQWDELLAGVKALDEASIVKPKPEVVPVTQNTNLYAKGRVIKLVNANLYANSESTKIVSRKNGTYYIYDGVEIDGRYRITNSKSNVGMLPLGSHVTGYINKSSIK